MPRRHQRALPVSDAGAESSLQGLVHRGCAGAPRPRGHAPAEPHPRRAGVHRGRDRAGTGSRPGRRHPLRTNRTTALPNPMSGFRRDHRDHNRSTRAVRRPSVGGRAALRGAFALASILTVAQGCDKARELAGGGGAEAAEPAAADRLDLSSRPEILFQVFGESNDARMIPIAVIQGGRLEQIVLGSAGWKQFDGMYGKSGTSYTLYADGRSVGSAIVRQGMWEKPQEPLYSLPSCELMIPLARVRLDTRMKLGFTVEAFASNATLGRASGSPGMRAGDVEDAARQVGEAAAQRARISSGTLESLSLSADAIEVRAGGPPMIVATFTDPKADD